MSRPNWPPRTLAVPILIAGAAFLLAGCQGETAEPEAALPEVTILTAVPNLAFAAVSVAEQLDYFAEEGVRATVSVAGGGSTCMAAVVGRSAQFCAASSEGLILARGEGAPLIAIQAHNRSLTLGVTVRKQIADERGLTRESPLEERMNLLPQLGTIGGTSPGAVSEQIFKYLMTRMGEDPASLTFAYLGGAQLPAALADGAIDAFAQSPPTGEGTEALGFGYVLIPLSLGEVPELTDYPYEVLIVRSEWAEQNPDVARAVSRAISRAGALIRSQPEEAKAALRTHSLFNAERLEQPVFDLAFEMISAAIPEWGDMTEEGWQ